jgi:cytochrome c oxidase assembly protein subunit 15
VPLAVGLRLTRSPARARRLGWVLLGLLGAQGAVGYTQYFTGLPAGLVWGPRLRLAADLDRRPCG